METFKFFYILSCLILVFRSANGLEGDLRLQGGNSSFGRLMVWLEEEWATVCSDWWSQENTNVACQQMGFELGGKEVKKFNLSHIDLLREGVRIGLDNVECASCFSGVCKSFSHQRKLINCKRNLFFQHDCTHAQDVYLSCNDVSKSGDIMIHGKRQFKKLFYLYNSRWMGVCGKKRWSQMNTNVVCNQLGYYCGRAKTVGMLGSPNQSVAIYDVFCRDLDRKFKDCDFKNHENIDDTPCTHRDDMFVHCSSQCSKQITIGSKNPVLYVSPLFNLSSFTSTFTLRSNTSTRLTFYSDLHKTSETAGIIVTISKRSVGCEGPIPHHNKYVFNSPTFKPLTFRNCNHILVSINLANYSNYRKYSYEIKINTTETVEEVFTEKPRSKVMLMTNDTDINNRINCGVQSDIPVQWLFRPHNRTLLTQVIYFNDRFFLQDFQSYLDVETFKGSGSRNLIFKKVIPGAAGTYHCVQNNGAGSVASAEVIVMEYNTECAVKKNYMQQMVDVNCYARYYGNYGPVINATNNFVKSESYTSADTFNTTISYRYSTTGSNFAYKFVTFFKEPVGNAPTYVHTTHKYFNGKNGDIQLVGGNSSFGRLMVNLRGEWTTVCDDDWLRINTIFVCQQLGFSLGGHFVVNKTLKSQITAGNDFEIGMSFVRCHKSTTPRKLVNCQYREPYSCTHKEDVFISCNTYNGMVRWVRHSGEFRKLMISLDGRWSSICSKKWTEVNTKVACRERGEFCGKHRHFMYSPDNNVPIKIQNFDCSKTPNATKLFSCAHENYDGLSCTFSDQIYLACMSDCKKDVAVDFSSGQTNDYKLSILILPSSTILPFNSSKTFKFESSSTLTLTPVTDRKSKFSGCFVEVILNSSLCKGPFVHSNSSFFFNDPNFSPLTLWDCKELTLKFSMSTRSRRRLIDYTVILSHTSVIPDAFVERPQSTIMEGSWGAFKLKCQVVGKETVQWLFKPYYSKHTYPIFFNNILNPQFNYLKVYQTQPGTFLLEKEAHKLVNSTAVAGHYSCVPNNGAGVSARAAVFALETEPTCDTVSLHVYSEQQLLISCQVTFYGPYSPVIDVQPRLENMIITNSTRGNRMFYIVKAPAPSNISVVKLTVTTFFAHYTANTPSYKKLQTFTFQIYTCPTNCRTQHNFENSTNPQLRCQAHSVSAFSYRWYVTSRNKDPIATQYKDILKLERTKKKSKRVKQIFSHDESRVLLEDSAVMDVSRLLVGKTYLCQAMQPQAVQSNTCFCNAEYLHVSGGFTQRLFAPRNVLFYVPKNTSSTAFVSTVDVSLPASSRVILKPQLPPSYKKKGVTIVVKYKSKACQGPYNERIGHHKYTTYPFMSLTLWNCQKFTVLFKLTKPLLHHRYLRNISTTILADNRSKDVFMEAPQSVALSLPERIYDTLNCRVETNEDVQWIFKSYHKNAEPKSIYFNGRTKHHRDLYNITFHQKTSFLRLRTVNMKDLKKVVGRYTCVLNNGAGGSRSAEIVLIDSKTRCFSKTTRPMKGELVVISCIAAYRGSFAPVIVVDSSVDSFRVTNHTSSTTMLYHIEFNATAFSKQLLFTINTFFNQPYWSLPHYTHTTTISFTV